EAIGQPILILVPPGLEPEVTALLEQSARGEAIRTLETIRQTKHGRRFDASVSVAPIRDEEDRVVAISTIERDISRSKRIEGALRRSRTNIRGMNRTLEARVEERTGELRRANYALKLRNRELEDFTHIASHDLQEPLRKIHTFADLLQEEYREHFDGHAD